MTIDFHTHVIPERFKQALQELNIDPLIDDGFPLPEWDMDNHLNFMAEAGIDYAIVSLPSPHIHNGDDEKSAHYARLINQEMHEITSKYSDKLGFVACLPLPNITGSLKEIQYALDDLGAIGVKVPTNANGIYFGDPMLDDVLQALNERQALVIIHPNKARQVPNNVMTSQVAALFEYPTETTRLILNMVMNNVMVRFPNIKFVVPHTGSFIPYMAQRLAGIATILASRGMMDSIDVYANLKNLYFDVAGDPEPIALESLLMLTDEDHLVYGSDYPYVPQAVLLSKKQHLESNSKYQHLIDKIYSENAKKLLEHYYSIKQ